MAGILAYGAYVPPGRLDRSAIAATLAQPGGRGTRSVASHDEDSTTLAVEAARTALRRAPDGAHPQRVVFSTATPTYLDRTNATVVHAALDLDPTVAAYDFGGAARSWVGALTTALAGRDTTLVVGADVRTDGHHAIVRGREQLSGAPVRATDIRAGAALVLAGLVAEGVTVVADGYHVVLVEREQTEGVLGAGIEERALDGAGHAATFPATVSN